MSLRQEKVIELDDSTHEGMSGDAWWLWLYAAIIAFCLVMLVRL